MPVVMCSNYKARPNRSDVSSHRPNELFRYRAGGLWHATRKATKMAAFEVVTDDACAATSSITSPVRGVHAH